MWLQITGGEPLLDKDFIEVYKFAHYLGLLITLSTNGSLLTERRIAEVIETYPPYRLVISVYGATADSYESLTGIHGSFQQFMNGINWANKKNIKTRLNIITTKYNQNEIDDMVDLAKDHGFEYFIFSTLSPTIEGDLATTELMPQDCESIKKRNKPISKENHYVQCMAGKTFFHVNSSGKMSICKTAREPNIDLFQDSTTGFFKLSEIANGILGSQSLCSSCELRENCTTCPPTLKLYLHSKIMPSFICSKYCSDQFTNELTCV